MGIPICCKKKIENKKINSKQGQKIKSDIKNLRIREKKKNDKSSCLAVQIIKIKKLFIKYKTF